MKRIILLLTIVTSLISCSNEGTSSADINENQTVYINGDIITMEGESPAYVEALVEENGLIVFVGSETQALETYSNAKQVDLNGRTLLPGLIDGHSHFASFGSQAIGANLLPSPDGDGNDIDELIRILKEWDTPENVAMTGWIFGMGFDDSVIDEKRFPTKEDLDKVSTDTPVVIIHISGHFCVVNSKGLELFGIDANTEDPEGGLIRRMPGSNEPNGVLEELAAIPNMVPAITPITEEGLKLFLNAGQDLALSFGYTTAQEGRAMEQHEILASAAEEGVLKIDVVSYIDYLYMDRSMNTKWKSDDYQDHYRIAGVKITLDGSPQGRTAWRTIPYVLPPEGSVEGYLGYPAFTNDEDVQNVYDTAYENNWQIISHANGDAAMDQMIAAMTKSAEKFGIGERRNTLIHGQYVRDDQLDSFKELDVITSLFPMHTFYWGDWHKEIIGDELGSRISPARSALDKGLRISLHTDAPIALPNLMMIVWTAVTRTSRSGEIIGAEERITPFEALKAITIWSAYQHFEEDRKGSLVVGKLADLVILSENPLKVNPDDIKDIVVLQTIKDGSRIYENSDISL